MLPLWAQWLFGSGAIGLLVAVIAGAVTAWVKLRDHLTRIEWSIEQIRTQGNGHLSLTGSLVTSLNRQVILQPEDMSTILQSYFELAQIPRAPNNPITPEEHDRLTYYLELARKGGPFTPYQVRDYQAIVKKLQEEKRNDRDDRVVWALVGLGALLLGLYLLGRKEQQ